MPPLVGVRGDVFVEAGVQFGGEAGRDVEVLRGRVRLERAVGRDLRGTFRRRVVAVGEAEGLGSVPRAHG